MRARLRLDQVWLLVSPGNPLKPAAGMAPFAARLASATAIADGRRIIATDLEARMGTRYSVDTIAALRQRFPAMRFIWLMGADSFAELPRWHDWTRFARSVAIAVHPRQGADHRALAGAASRRWPRLPPRRLATAAPPGWSFLPLARHHVSATALREAGLGIIAGSNE